MTAQKTDNVTTLLRAAMDNNVATAEAILKTKLNPNIKGDDGLTPLMIAAGRGHVDMVRLLLAHDADPCVADRKGGATALHKACQIGSLEATKLLVEAGAFINQQCATTGHTPLIDAIWFKWPEVVAYLLDQGANLTIGTYYGFSLEEHVNYMIMVTQRGKKRLLEIKNLLDARQAADQEAVENQKLMSAVVAGDLNEVKRLLATGADVAECAPILGGFNDGHTPLHVAARENHPDMVKALLNAGADVNTIEPVFGAVPLHKSTYHGHVEVTAILAGHPGVNLDYPGPANAYTPLHDALWHGYAECSKILVDAGARLDLEGHDGKTPLDVAIEVFGTDHEICEAIRDKAGT